MGDEKENRQKQSLVEDRVNQRPLAQPAARIEDLKQHHDLGEHKGVDEGEALHGEIDPMLAQDDVLIDDEDAEQNPKVEEQDDEPAEFVDRFGFERPGPMSARARRRRCSARPRRTLRHRITLVSPRRSPWVEATGDARSSENRPRPPVPKPVRWPHSRYGRLSPFFEFDFFPFSLAAAVAAA